MRGESRGEELTPRRSRGIILIQYSRESTHLDTGVLQNTQQHRKLQFWRVFDRDAAYDWIAGDLLYTTECPKLLPQGLHFSRVLSQDHRLHTQPAFHMMHISIRRGGA